ncbi:peptidyl-prolyl cis-trans isomerase cyp15 [Dimargaris cristalligena]|uniref:peptidylprolyl isomerase n=1 Tax=Dimargaris cristalligena TaxID=215637 RepID=A0A4P9ZMA8_9FUNG|nr:peptidyl-prolyl cis-trans isomerase cyp15 [Dimargaris cristalligena]|eukprot:RKP34278.1 peptidyl-prolyl cis-trans isomerase cyp15 [Dimargaris cristalligena]
MSDSEAPKVPEPERANPPSDDVGPLPPSAADAEGPRKKRRVLPHEPLYLRALPDAEMYERSYMHSDVLTYTNVAANDFVITTSSNGHLKFWKKIPEGIEFVKHFRSHLGPITGVALSADGLLFATISTDKTLKIYDVINFDMINAIRLDYTPRCVCWFHRRGQAQAVVACTDLESSLIYLYDGRGDGQPLHTISSIHSKPVTLMTFNPLRNCVVSVDSAGMCEYWTPEAPTFELPSQLGFRFKSETDLYEFKKGKCVPTSLTFSPDYNHFVTLNVDDRQIRVFKFDTGKLIRKYDESLDTISNMQQAGTCIYKLDPMEFGRRRSVELELQNSPLARTMNAVFDQSGHFILYPTMEGIKVVNIVTNKVALLLGKSEPLRFLNLSLYQGIPLLAKQPTGLARMTAQNPLLQIEETGDPTLFATAYRRNRFYLFTRRDPHSDRGDQTDRDIFNEKPSREEQTLAIEKPLHQELGSAAVMHTTLGDIHFKLFPEQAPKAVENFVTHARQGYYNRLIFHRVIKGFMLQTGDPLGDGTGGESIWGEDFEDEFHRDLRHDRPYTLSMANAGPNTNGSQFFITVVPTPWLDNKHTVFGRVTAGMDTVHMIENVKVDKQDKPYDDVQIVSIDVR